MLASTSRGLAEDACAQFGGRISTHVTAGTAWKQILRIAADLEADLIVIGTRGRGGVKRLVLGSVAELVVRKACCPVFVAREKGYQASTRESRHAG